MKNAIVLEEIGKKQGSEAYIEFLCSRLGASREEIMEVSRHSGISARRIAEYLLQHQQRNSTTVSEN